MIIDLYAGPRGWSEGLRILGLADLGFELDRWACATAAAAGHRTIRADVTSWPLGPLAGRVEGVIASPPCQAFSSAGNGEGRRYLGELRADIDRGDYGNGYPEGVGHVLEVGRWVEALRPRWVAAEQVPPVLPLWRAYARRFRQLGYSAWAGVLNAADFGVPQTRKRAILVASLDRVAGPPAATHARRPVPQLFGELARWVSMAEALGWGLPAEPSPVVMTARNDALNGSSWRRDWFRRQQHAGNWVVRTGANTMVTGRTGSRAGDGDVRPYERSIDEPAPTLDSKVGSAWTLHTNRRPEPDGSRQVVTVDRPAPAVTGKAGGQWVFDRPATTIAGDPRITARCHHDEGTQDANAKTTAQVRAGDYEGTEPIHLEIREALILQSFDPGYPVQGTKTKQFEQIGNAVPPRLAAHILAAVTGRPTPTFDRG